MTDLILQFVRFHPEITILGAVTLVQIAPIKLDPWTALAKWFKRILVGDIEGKIDCIANKVNHLGDRIGENEAKTARAHIHRFADELYNETIKHSKEYFDDILDDITDYEAYCEAHPNFQNKKTAKAVQLINETYDKLYREHKFL